MPTTFKIFIGLLSFTATKKCRVMVCEVPDK